MTSFGERLRQLRLNAGLSQVELAGEGLSPSYISLLEVGKRSPSSEVVQQLAVRLGCSTTQLVEGKPSERDQRIELELAYARLAINHGESQEARIRLDRLLMEDGLPQHVRDDLSLWLGIATERLGDLPAAMKVFQSIFERAMTQQTHLPVSMVGIGLVRCYLHAGDLHQAAATGERAIASAAVHHLAGTDDYYRLAATVMEAYIGLGDFLHARVWADRFLEEAQAHSSPMGQAALYWNSALLAEHEGRLGEALALCDRALGLYGELGTVRDTPRLHLDMAALLLADEPPQAERAAALLDRCFEDLNDLGSRVDRARWNWLRATALLCTGDLVTAEARARQAVGLIEGAEPPDRASAQMVLHDVLAARGRSGEADEALMATFEALMRSRGTRTSALQWREAAERLAACGRIAEGLEAYRRALDAAGVRLRTREVLRRITRLSAAPSVDRLL